MDKHGHRDTRRHRDTHRRTHTDTQTHTDTGTHTDLLIHTNTRTHADTETCADTGTHTDTGNLTNLQTQRHTQTQGCTQTQGRTQTCRHRHRDTLRLCVPSLRECGTRCCVLGHTRALSRRRLALGRSVCFPVSGTLSRGEGLGLLFCIPQAGLGPESKSVLRKDGAASTPAHVLSGARCGGAAGQAEVSF